MIKRFAWAIAGLIVLTGCVSTPPVREVPVAPVEPPPKEVVVSVDRAPQEMVATLELIKAEKYRQSEANLEGIIKARADIPEAHFNLGWVRFKLERYPEAVTSLQAGLLLRPNDLQALNLLALAQREAGRFAEAEQTWLRAIQLQPANQKLAINLAVLYEQYLNRPAAALEQYRRYQTLLERPDPKVAQWIALLERRQGGAP